MIREKSGTLRRQGELVGDVLVGVATGGAMKAASKTAVVAKIASKLKRLAGASEAAADGAELAGSPEAAGARAAAEQAGKEAAQDASHQVGKETSQRAAKEIAEETAEQAARATTPLAGEKRVNKLFEGTVTAHAPTTGEVVPRLGPRGLDPAHHNANVMVRDASGQLRNHERLVSGNMTAEEQALGFPRNTLASHTEARAIRNIPVQPGGTMIVTGQRPPCPICKGLMNQAARDRGARFIYRWRENGVTRTWTAGGN
jgi:hypothetical protein